MSFRMKAGPEGPMVKNYSAFKHKGCSKHKHPHFRNTVRTNSCSKGEKVKKVVSGIAKAGALVGMAIGAKKKFDNM